MQLSCFTCTLQRDTLLQFLLFDLHVQGNTHLLDALAIHVMSRPLAVTFVTQLTTQDTSVNRDLVIIECRG